MDDDLPLNQSGTGVSLGDDLYGLSREELSQYIDRLKAEIVRVEAELSKKTMDHAAADLLFSKKA